MQIPICDGFYEHASQDVNNQQSINLFPAPRGTASRGAAKEQFALLPTAGLVSLVNSGGTVVRALIPFKDMLYAAIDTTLYEVTIDFQGPSATLTSRGSLLGGDFLSWAVNQTQIFISEGSAGASVFTPSTNTMAQITDPDFQGSGTVTYMDGYFIYNIPDTQQMATTAIEDGTDISSLDIATAEGSPDEIVAVISDKRELWALGKTSAEIWWNKANPLGFPFTRREGAYLDIGCIAARSAININNTMMWLDHRRYVVVTQGYGLQIISTPAINEEFASYEVVNDAFAYDHLDRGHLFYVITFPTENKTWVYDLTTQRWHQRCSWDPVEQKNAEHLAKGKTTYQGREIVGGAKDGTIYLMSKDYYDEAGTVMFRKRTTPYVNDEFKFVGIDALEVHLETGVAPVVGDGSDPGITLRYSNDGGHTWSHSQTRSMGEKGKYGIAIRWNRLGTAREWLFEFTISDPVKFAISDASIEPTLEIV